MNEWPLWEIFIRSQHGLAHKHVGSLHAPDAEMAVKNARDVYTRRNEGVSIWVVKSSDITASSPGEKDVLFEPAHFIMERKMLLGIKRRAEALRQCLGKGSRRHVRVAGEGR